jgi:hypothetical protein
VILVADMVRNLCPHIATDAVVRRTSEGFATVKQRGKGWTWEPNLIGLGPLLPKPVTPYISQRAAYDGLQRAITALLREGLKERRCAE